MGLTELPTDDVPERLEEMLLSGWAFLDGPDDIIQAVMNAVSPQDFRVIMLLRGKQQILRRFYLVKAEVFMAGDVPEGDDIRGFCCRKIWIREDGVPKLEYTPLPLPDELVRGFVENLLKKGG